MTQLHLTNTDLRCLQVNTMETNPFMRTSISDLVHVRNEAYKGLALEVDLVEERLIEVETIVTSLGSGTDARVLPDG